MMTLSEAQNEAFLTAVPEAQRDNPQFQATRNLLDKSKTILSEVNLSLLQNQQKNQGDEVLTGKALIVDFYPYSEPQFNVQKFKESEVRGIEVFSGAPTNGLSIDWTTEQFLCSLNTTGQQLALSERGLVFACLAKLQGPSNQIIRARLDSLGLTPETVPFSTLQRIIERAYMPHSDPQNSLKSLMNLQPLAAGSTDFLLLESVILRLTRLSLKGHENESEKKILQESRAKEHFLRLIPVAEKRKIQQRNLSRVETGLSELSLHAMVTYLIDTSKIDNPQSISSGPYLGSSINRVSQNSQNAEPEEADQIFWAQNPQNRSGPPPPRFQRARAPSPPPKGKFQPSGPRGTFRGRPHPPRNLRPPAPARPFPNAPYPPRGAKPPPRGGYTRREPPSKNTEPPFNWTHEALGIVKGGCFLCGQPRPFCRGYRDNSCPYRGVTPCRTRCRNPPNVCSGGAHKTSNCLGLLHNAVHAYKKQKLAEKGHNDPPNVALAGAQNDSSEDPTFNLWEDPEDPNFEEINEADDFFQNIGT